MSVIAAVRLRTFNLATLAIGLIGAGYFVWFLGAGGPWTAIAWVRLPVLGWYALVPWLVTRQKRPIAQLGTLIVANVNLVVIALLLGREAGVQVVLFSLVTIPLVIFEPGQRKLLLFSMGLPFVARMVFELFAGPIHEQRFTHVHPFAVGMVLQTFVVLSVPVFVFVNESLRAQRSLESASAELRSEMERRGKAEEELEIARRTEAMGRLAAGIAHEINTPVQYASDSVSFAQQATTDLLSLVRVLDALTRGGQAGTAVASAAGQATEEADLEYLDEQVPKALERAKEGLQRVAELVRSMKEFSHPDQKEMSSVDLNRVIQNALTVARGEYKYVAELQTELGDIPQVTCHGGEIGQVLLNLVVNAAHAIAHVVEGTDRKGCITVRTQRDADAVVISVRDTGAGVPDAIAHRIFEPFFTTKEVGKGTGQGLAISYGIVARKHRGVIRFESEAGQGTTFFVRLPIEQPASAPAG